MLTEQDGMRVNTLLAQYGAALDERRYQDWLSLFDESCSYVLQPRENYDQQLPLATMRLESRGMLTDRIYGIENTLFHQPYYQRHLIGVCMPCDAPVGLPHQTDLSDTGDCLGAQANYAVFRTKADSQSDVFNVGRYLLQLVRRDDQLRIRRMHVVFDSELVANSLIYPI